MIPTLFGVSATSPQVVSQAILSIRAFEDPIPEKKVIDGSFLNDFVLLGKALARLTDGRARSLGLEFNHLFSIIQISAGIGDLLGRLAFRANLAQSLLGVKQKDWKEVLERIREIEKIPLTPRNVELTNPPRVQMFHHGKLPFEIEPDNRKTAVWPTHQNTFQVPESEVWVRRDPITNIALQRGNGLITVSIRDKVHGIDLPYLVEETRKIDSMPFQGNEKPQKKEEKLLIVATHPGNRSFFRFILGAYFQTEEKKEEKSFWVVLWRSLTKKSQPELIVIDPGDLPPFQGPCFLPYKDFVRACLAGSKHVDERQKGYFVFEPLIFRVKE